MVDYSKWFRTSADVRRELEALHDLDRHKDDYFRLYKYSKRRERLIRIYWIYYLRESAEREKRQKEARERYRKRKAEIINEAIDWSLASSEKDMTWAELADKQDYFLRLGRRYGLLQEFRENGIC